MFKNKCRKCGREYKVGEGGGVNFCSRSCYADFQALQREKWLKTHSAWEYLHGETIGGALPGIRLKKNDAVSENIRRQYRNMPKTRDFMLAQHAEELKQKQKELQGYRFSNKQIV